MGCLLKFVMVGVFMLLAKVSSRSSKLSNLKDGAIVACKDIERNIVYSEDFQKDMSKANVWTLLNCQKHLEKVEQLFARMPKEMLKVPSY